MFEMSNVNNSDIDVYDVSFETDPELVWTTGPIQGSSISSMAKNVVI